MRTNAYATAETAPIFQATDEALTNQKASSKSSSDVARARAFVEPFLSGNKLATGEDVLSHADAVSHILKCLHSSDSLQTAAYLIYAVEHIHRPKDVIGKAFDESMADLVIDTNRLLHVQRAARDSTLKGGGVDFAKQTESARKMLLAFSRDLRGVMLRLVSRLQTLRYAAENNIELPKNLAEETLHVFAPLASRLGIWQLKWQLEDLSFRYIEPATYKKIAKLLSEKRTEREDYVESIVKRLKDGLTELGIEVDVSGRPKHIYSIWKKMNGKSMDFSELYDIRAFRIIVGTVEECYRVLDWVNEHFQSLSKEFDDYIAKPKINGYQSLHVIVKDKSLKGLGKVLEVQIRTQDMHDRAESGDAAHWAYKEAGTKGYAGVVANSDYDARIAFLRQLLAWERDLSSQALREEGAGLFDDRIYVLTPDAKLLDLPQNSTPLDFAYAIHTELGHRCRGAKVDGQMVPIDTKLKNGQTVEIVTIREGGPSRDWLNADANYLASPRAKAKVRAWFNAQEMQQTTARGREQVEKLLQREGKTAVKLDLLANQLGFKSADGLFELVGKDEYSLKNIEMFFNPLAPSETEDEHAALTSPLSRKDRAARKSGSKNGILVVGQDSLLTQLAKCCKPAPPDPIMGYVTRGKGVSIHRADCTNVQELKTREPGRVIVVAWDASKENASADSFSPLFPVDIELRTNGRQGLFRDVSEVIAKEKMNIVSVNTQSARDKAGSVNKSTLFTIEVPSTKKLEKTLYALEDVPGVLSAKRR